MTHSERNCGCGGKGEWAIWLTPNTLAWPTEKTPEEPEFRLQGHPELRIRTGQLSPTEAALDGRVRRGDYIALRIAEGDAPVTAQRVRELLKGPLRLETRSHSGLLGVSGIQIAPVLDVLYPGAEARKLGLTWKDGRPTLALWAPTAQRVRLKLWVAGAPRTVPATRDSDGVWTVVGEPGWGEAEFLWEVRVYVPSLGALATSTVTDPYSIGLTIDSKRSVIVDRDQWKPQGWSADAGPRPINQAAQTIYELHVRDFSAWDTTVPADMRGTYSAFCMQESAGTNALRLMAAAGLSTVHLLPTFDISSESIPENRLNQRNPTIRGVPLLPQNEDQLAASHSWSRDSSQPQKAVAEVADVDPFNWGYDPQHWMTPEGSYARSGRQVGGARTLEYREMISALHGMGLRVVQDVVFNHTFAWGQGKTSVLDKVVPGYYHRLAKDGQVETSTCCSNVATEHLMAQKLMVDAVVDAAVNYHVDGFRFDLMGHHSLGNMKAVRAALDCLTPDKDGVDGESIYLYGEGWDFGEVSGDALFQQATIRNIEGTGIGVFNDRLRDAVRGGAPMDKDQRQQGFATGLYLASNRGPDGEGEGEGDGERERLYRQMDLIKLSLVGAIKDYPMPLSGGSGTVSTSSLRLFGQPAAFAREPQECVNYVEAHDDLTLYDAAVWKLPLGTPMSERVKVQVLANALVALGQGVAFWAAGTELLRSKSLDRDSYNSGDWFNAIDWEGKWNQFGRGLPSGARNRGEWDSMRPLLSRPELRPDGAAMDQCRQQSLELLRLRSSSPLFTLGSAKEIRARVRFLPTGAGEGDMPGVIAMWIDAEGREADLPVGTLPLLQQLPDGEQGTGLLTVFNASPSPWAGQLGGLEEVTVPGRSVRVFVTPGPCACRR